MQREREGRNDDLADEFFDVFRGFGMTPSLFGRRQRDPFDDPFFTRPVGSMFEPRSFGEAPAAGADHASSNNETKGIVIEEVTEGEKDEDEEHGKTGNEKNDVEKNCTIEEPSVEHPDDEVDADGETRIVNRRNDRNSRTGTETRSRNFSFQTCKVTYGGVDGAYYTSTRTRRAGEDGVVIEESKEADKTTGQATHRISRGIHDKGHSVTRKLNSDGKVDTVQTLHNLNEDELAGFEEAWKGSARGRLPGWSNRFDMHDSTGSTSSEQERMPSWGSWALPLVEQAQNANPSGGRTKKVVRVNIE